MKEVKYKIYSDSKNSVIAVSTYAGKTVKGVAKCDPRDAFDLETGKRIAEARCAKKIAEKRYDRAVKKYREATILAKEANDYLERMGRYLHDASVEIEETEDTLEEILSEV